MHVLGASENPLASQKTMTSRSNQNSWALFALLCLGFGLRVGGITFGLPNLYHADEPIVVHHALAYASGDFHPHFFKIPPLVSYLLFPFYGLLFVLGKGIGFFQTPRDFEVLFFQDPSLFFLLARLLFGVFLGTATLYFFYRALVKVFGDSAALLATFFLSICFLHVRNSHYIYVDIPLVFVWVLALGPFFAIAKQAQTKKPYLWAGVLIGVATALKYNGVLLAVPFVFVSLMRGGFKALSAWIVPALLSFGVYAILNPFSLLDFPFFLQEIKQQAGSHQGEGDWIFHFHHSLWGALEVPLLLFCLLGLGRALRFKPSSEAARLRIPLVVFVVTYYIVISRWGQPYARYVLPMLPFLIFFAADFLTSQSFFKGKRRFLAWLLLLLFISGPSLSKSLKWNLLMLQPDTRTQAAHWIQSKVPSNARVALDHEFLMPRLRMSAKQLTQKKENLEKKAPQKFSAVRMRKLEQKIQESLEKPAYELFSLSESETNKDAEFLFAKPTAPYDLKQLQVSGIQYVVVARIWEKDIQQDFYDRLAKEGELVAEFNPYKNSKHLWMLQHPLTGGPFLWQDVFDRKRNGPPILIYKI